MTTEEKIEKKYNKIKESSFNDLREHDAFMAAFYVIYEDLNTNKIMINPLPIAPNHNPLLSKQAVKAAIENNTENKINHSVVLALKAKMKTVNAKEILGRGSVGIKDILEDLKSLLQKEKESPVGFSDVLYFSLENIGEGIVKRNIFVQQKDKSWKDETEKEEFKAFQQEELTHALFEEIKIDINNL